MRKFLILAIFAISVVVSATTSFAKQDESNRYTPKSVYTALEFARLSEDQIDAIESAYQRGKNFKVKGFSGNMATWLIDMAIYDRRRTQKLIRDMDKLTSKKDRVARLKLELERTEKLIEKNDKAIAKAEARIKKKDSQVARLILRSETSRAIRTERFQKGLKLWIRHPHEGTRN